MDWSQLNPNTLVVVGTAVVSLATWLYHKAKGDKVDSFDDAIRGLGKQAIHELLNDPAVTTALSSDVMQKKAEDLLTAAAQKLDLPINTITTALIKATAAHVVGDVQAELRTLDDANDQLAALTKQVTEFPAKLDQLEKEAFARGKAFADEMVERVPADAPTTPTP